MFASITPAEAAAVTNGVNYLNQRMDEYHRAFEIYRDISSAGNHFHARQKIPDAVAAVTIDGSWTRDVYEGATSMRYSFKNVDGSNFGGFYLQNGYLGISDKTPQLNFGQVPNAGVNLSGAKALSMKVKGAQGGEKIEFFHGGIGRDPNTGLPNAQFPDSSPRFPSVGVVTTLSNTWQTIEIPLQGLDLSYTLGFGWIANAPSNPNGAVFFMDDVKYILNDAAAATRLDEPRFVQSFKTLAVQPDLNDGNPDNDIDLVLRNGASAYDNSIALLTYIAHGSPDSLRRAKLIGDAFLRAMDHDRSFDNGAIRRFYMAGDISLPPAWTPVGRVGTVPIPGFYIESSQSFVEIEQDALDVGTNTWVTIALLALYRRTHESKWLAAAERIGDFILQFRQDTGAYQGFRGGLENPETAQPRERDYAATEHQLDIIAASRMLLDATGKPKWRDAERHAWQFVDQMFDSSTGCRFTGTRDSNIRNETFSQLPLDAQSWFVLALPDENDSLKKALSCAEQNHNVETGSLVGFDFNTDRDGVWFEGTAQTTIAYSAAGDLDNARLYRQELIKAQTPLGQPSSGALFASNTDKLTTGFDFKYFRREHIAAVSWAVMCWLDFNPFYQSFVTQPFHNRSDPLDVDRDHVVSPLDVLATVNRINAVGSGYLTKPFAPTIPDEYWDTNGDDFLGPLDVLLIINHLNRKSAGEGENSLGEVSIRNSELESNVLETLQWPSAIFVPQQALNSHFNFNLETSSGFVYFLKNNYDIIVPLQTVLSIAVPAVSSRSVLSSIPTRKAAASDRNQLDLALFEVLNEDDCTMSGNVGSSA